MSYFEQRRAPDLEGIEAERKAHRCCPPQFNPFGMRFGFGAKWRCRYPLGTVRNCHIHCDALWEYAVSNRGAGFWRGVR